MTTHPRLRTTHRLLTRSDGDLQLGTGDDALVLAGLPPALLPVLQRLDGVTSLPALRHAASSAGVDADQLDRLLDVLDEAGALDRTGPTGRGHERTVPHDQVDALAGHGLGDTHARARLARLARVRVTVLGRGPLPDALAEELRHHVDRVDQADADHPAPAGDILVLTGHEALDPLVAGRAVLTGRPVLPVVAHAHTVVVGPWHTTLDDPCPVCLDLRRRDGDDDWPQLLTQLLDAQATHRSPRVVADPVAARLAAAVTAQWVRRRVVGLPETPGLTCEVDAWQLGMTHRVWPVHPRCARHEPALPLGA